MKRYFVFIMIYVLFKNILIAQSLQPQVSVDTYTGKGSITIPLTSVNVGRTSLPIDLIYNAGGLRADDDGNKMGVNSNRAANSIKIAANWNLFAGGAISRTIKGIPDDYYGSGSDSRRGWLYGTGAQIVNDFVSSSDNDLNNCDDEQTDYNILHSLGDNIDTEPDIFNFDFGGFQGQFVFDYQTQTGVTMRPIHTMPYQDLKISYTLINNKISEFEIVTNEGTIYKFIPTLKIKKTILPSYYKNYFNTTINRNSQPIEYTEEWGLSSIRNKDNQQILSLSYDVLGFKETNDVPLEIVLPSPSLTGYNERMVYIEHLERSFSVIESINAVTGYKVSVYDNRIEIYNPELVRKIFFIKEQHGSRTFLKKIIEQNDCLMLSPIEFEYNELTNLPPLSGTQTDLWGYSNIDNRTIWNGFDIWQKSFPDICYYIQSDGTSKYSLWPLKGDGNFLQLLGGGPTWTDEVSMKRGMLNKVKLPSGGYITIEVESNVFCDETANDDIMGSSDLKGGGLRVKKIVSHDGVDYHNDKIVEYEYEPFSGRLTYLPVYAFSVPFYRDFGDYYGNTVYPHERSGTGLELFMFRYTRNMAPRSIITPDVVYGKVTEVHKGNGKIEYNYITPSRTNELSVHPELFPYNFNATLSKIARKKISGSCPESGVIRNDQYSFPFPDNTNYNFEYGLLSSKKIYNESGNIVKEIQYSYQRLNKELHPRVIKGIKLESHKVNNEPFYFFGQYSLLTNIGKVVAEEKTITYDQVDLAKKLETVTQYAYNSPNHRLLNKISTINSDGTIYTTRISYPEDYTVSNNGSSEFRSLYLMKQNNILSFPIEQAEYIQKPGESEKLLKSTLTTFKNYSLYGAIHINPDKLLELNTSSALSDFTPLYTETKAGVNNVIYDSRYKVKKEYINWHYGIATEVKDERKSVSSIILNDKLKKVADISNAKLSEIAFSDFTSPDTESSRVPGYHASVLNTGTQLVRNGIKNNGKNLNYTFSCWIKSSAEGILTMTLTNSLNQEVKGSIDYHNTGGEWKFYQKVIRIADLIYDFNVVITSSTNIVVDYDILLYPSLANINYYTYNQHGKTSDNSINGKSIFYEYDKLGRQIFTRNQDNYILKKTTYKYNSQNIINSEYTIEGTRKIGNEQVFSAHEQCVSEVTYSWDFGDGTIVTGVNPVVVHNYSQPGNYTVKLTTSHPQYGGTSTSKTFTIYRNAEINICTPGPSSFNFITYETRYDYSYSNYCGQSPQSPGENTFYASVSGDIPPTAIITYKWESLIVGNSNWKTYTNTSDTHNIYMDPFLPESSYIVKCTVTISNCDYLEKNTFEIERLILFVEN